MKISILGTRGIPAQHGGFETFAEHFSVYLQKKGWQVVVYCQKEGSGEKVEDIWKGIHRVHIPVKQTGAFGTIAFDWKSTFHAASRRIPVLTLGYNTAFFCLIYRFKGLKNIINMDGLEWRRAKWSKLERAWLYLNEKLGAWFGNHLIADHPEIKNHLKRFTRADKITVIPYSAEIITTADTKWITKYALTPNNYSLVIARPEPENSILDIVRAYSFRKRGMPLVILGNYSPQNEYHKKVLDAASDEVKFIGAIYDAPAVQALRFHARLYMHGHTVGGTNPSLVEALGAGSPILAHDNKFNRWVAGMGAHFFDSEEECERKISTLLKDDQEITAMRQKSWKQYNENFTSSRIYDSYENIIRRMITPI